MNQCNQFRLFIYFIWLALCTHYSLTAPNEVCNTLVYLNITQVPTYSNDFQAVCPEGNGPRAFLLSTSSNFPNFSYLPLGSLPAQLPQLKEVAPDAKQNFHCLPNRKCFITIRGYGLRAFDAIAILPKGETACPPLKNVFTGPQTNEIIGSSSPSDVAVIVRAENDATLASTRFNIPEASFAVFELPDRFAVSTGSHTVCYSPVLASRTRVIDEIPPEHFHYQAGLLHITDSVFFCNFEGYNLSKNIGGDISEIPLPCGFKNFRDQWTIDLVWQVGTGSTETQSTGPNKDTSIGLNGLGHYIYMDSPGFSLGAPATMISPPLTMPSGTFCVKFYYSMNGMDVSTLRVYLSPIKLQKHTSPTLNKDIFPIMNTNVTMLGYWGSPRWVAVGNKGSLWHYGGFEFRAYTMQTFQLIFEALAGRGEEGDIAVDDIDVIPGACPMEIKSHTPKTFGTRDVDHIPMICGEVRLNTGNYSVDKSWYVDGAISCSGRGYSLDQLNNTAWLPCCVPNFGAYDLILEDQLGDGWSGSQLEFRFFDQIMIFGKDEFKHSGFSKKYNLIIGSVEIINVDRLPHHALLITVKVARKDAYVWCGVVQADKEGKPLNVKLSSSLLMKYGVRSRTPSLQSNDQLAILIENILSPKTEYDVYCYSEVIGEGVSSLIKDDKTHQKEILATRLRVTTDDEPPHLMINSLYASYNLINVTFTINKSSSVWCVAEKKIKNQDMTSMSNNIIPDDLTALFDTGGMLAGLTHENPKNKTVQHRLSRYFKQMGTNVIVELINNIPFQTSLIIENLISNTPYDVLCYAEDFSQPLPNSLTAIEVEDNARPTHTDIKIPSVRITKRLTLLKGFRIHVLSDAPGKVWCAAAPSDYGLPDISEVIQVGVQETITDPYKEVSLDVRGVEPNTVYVIYCVGGIGFNYTLNDYLNNKEDLLSSQTEMAATAISVISYGRYCDIADGPDIFTESTDQSPFHPITTEEEMRVRDYILTRQELGLQGIYRINILPNKTEIYNYFDNNGTKPLRYARVRAGRCIGDLGFYEQFRVGPLNTPESNIGHFNFGNRPPMTYERIAHPIETKCGGYNPQGVFGRLLLQSSNDEKSPEYIRVKFGEFLKNNFGYTFGVDHCMMNSQYQLNHIITNKTNNHFYYNQTPDNQCLELGPVLLEETCDTSEDSLPCNSDNRGGRVWLGLKTPKGDKLPFYFIYELPKTTNITHFAEESATEWAKRLIKNNELTEDFHSFWEATSIWYNGTRYLTIETLLDAVISGNVTEFNQEEFTQQKKKVEKIMIHSIETERRQLAPLSMPYAGAAGTAGPLRNRDNKREGLEYRAHPEHIEAQGKRFSVEASPDLESYNIKYSGWSMTVSNDRDTGLRIYNLRFKNQRVAFEMGLMEALAHYSVSERNWFFLDSWYGGLGSAARKVFKGIECPKTGMSLFWDGSLCVFEQDMARPIRSHWRAGEIRNGSPHVSLVIRQMLTVSNYDYITDYRFHLTGMFEASVSFTGELYAGIEVPWYSARQADYGTQVTGAMRFGALHAHMIVWKIDFDIGPNDEWEKNSVYLTEVIQDPKRPGANKLKREFATHESDAAYFRNDSRPLVYEVVNEKHRLFGNYGGWRVMPFPGINPFRHDFELYSGPAAWAKYRTLSTVRKYSELDATLPRDNKFAKNPAISIDRYASDDEPIRNVDVVTWISDGIFHVPVIEDMPLTIPIGNSLGWLVKPANLFVEDPSMDLTNSMGGGLNDPGTCAVVRLEIGEVEPDLENIWNIKQPYYR